MKIPAILLVLLMMVQCLSAKKNPPADLYKAIDQMARQIPDSMTYSSERIAQYVCATFHTQTERARAIFIWMAWNIDYDIDNMFAINFYEKKEDIIAKPLQKRKGICNNYANLFTDICTKAGIKSYVVVGYTRQNGFADYIPHAWCAAEIDSAWYMFDPTWGSGYCHDGRFYRQINDHFFKAAPESFISSHMPFDPMWEFVRYPVTNQEFYDGHTQQNTGKPYFNYVDSIAAYEREDTMDQLMGEAARINANGVKNAMIFDRLAHIKLDIENLKISRANQKAYKEYERQNKMVDVYNQAANSYSDGVLLFNLFIDYRNKQFTPLKPDAQIQAMIDTSRKAMLYARERLTAVIEPPANIVPMAAKLNTAIDQALAQIDDQQKWLKDYFSRSKAGRKYAFLTRVSLFGN